MESNPSSPEKTKWPLRMAFISFLLFSIFWSLNAFFFWTFLLLSAYFVFLHFYLSGGIVAWLDGIFSGRRNRAEPPPNPYASFRPRQPEQQQSSQGKGKGFVQLIVVVFFLITLFTFLYGLFSRVENMGESAESMNMEIPEEETGTTDWLEKGNAALSNEKQDSALYYYGQALVMDPENVYGLYNSGLVYVLQDDYQNGNKFIHRCLQFHPDYDPAWWLLGWSYDKTGKTDSALYALEKAYQHEYYQPEFLQLLADVYMKKANRRNALEVYQRMYSLDSTRTDLLRRMTELDPSNAEKYRQR